MNAASAFQLTRYRREEVGFVFPLYNLVPNLTARENVLVAAELVESLIDVDEALRLLVNLNQELGKTMVIITHNAALAQVAQRVVHLRSGEVTEIEINDSPAAGEQIEWSQRLVLIDETGVIL